MNTTNLFGQGLIVIFLILFISVAVVTCFDNEERLSVKGDINVHIVLTASMMKNYAITNIRLAVLQNGSTIWGPRKYNVDDGGATIDEIPPGSGYIVHAEAMQADVVMCEGFSQTVTVVSGQTADAGYITLDCLDETPTPTPTTLPVTTFQQTYDFSGAAYREIGWHVKKTLDGGYLVAGSTSYRGGDMLLLRTSKTGELKWQKNYGFEGTEESAFQVESGTDGGYILVGVSNAQAGNNDTNIYIVKTDTNGEMQWEREYWTYNYFFGKSIVQAGSGYFIAGTTIYNGKWAIYGLRINSAGDKLWDFTFYVEGQNVECNSMIRSVNSHFIIVGYRGNYPNTGSVILNMSNSGAYTWANFLSGDNAMSVVQTSDNGYIVTGFIDPDDSQDYDAFLLKTDALGNEQWVKTYAETDFAGRSVDPTDDGGYIIAANADFSLTENRGTAYLLKTDSEGNEVWRKSFNGNGAEGFNKVLQTNDTGFIAVGVTTSFGEPNGDVMLVKTDRNGNM